MEFFCKPSDFRLTLCSLSGSAAGLWWITRAFVLQRWHGTDLLRLLLPRLEKRRRHKHGGVRARSSARDSCDTKDLDSELLHPDGVLSLRKEEETRHFHFLIWFFPGRLHKYRTTGRNVEYKQSGSHRHTGWTWSRWVAVTPLTLAAIWLLHHFTSLSLPSTDSHHRTVSCTGLHNEPLLWRRRADRDGQEEAEEPLPAAPGSLTRGGVRLPRRVPRGPVPALAASGAGGALSVPMEIRVSTGDSGVSFRFDSYH